VCREARTHKCRKKKLKSILVTASLETTSRHKKLKSIFETGNLRQSAEKHLWDSMVSNRKTSDKKLRSILD